MERPRTGSLVSGRIVLSTIIAVAVIIGLVAYGYILRDREADTSKTLAEIADLVSEMRYRAMVVVDRSRDVVKAPQSSTRLSSITSLTFATARLVEINDRADEFAEQLVLGDGERIIAELIALRPHILATAAAARDLVAGLTGDPARDAPLIEAVRASAMTTIAAASSFADGMTSQLAPSAQLADHQRQNNISLVTVLAFLFFVATVVFPASRRLREASTTLESHAAQFARLALIAERTSNAVIISDRIGRIEWVNEAFTRISGYTLAEVVGRMPSEFLNAEETDPETIAALGSAIREGRSVRREILNRGKHGGSYWLDVQLQPLTDANGVVTGFMAIEIDITEAKQAHAALAQHTADLAIVADVAGVGPWRIDAATGEIWWSGIVCKIHEVDDDFRPTFEQLLDFHPGPARETLQRAIDRAIDQHEPWNLVLPVVTARGRAIQVRVLGTPQFEGERLVAIIGATQDVTAEIEAQETIRKVTERLEIATRNANVGLWDIDLDSCASWYSPDFWLNLGYTSDQVPTSIASFDDMVHPDDIEGVDRIWNASIEDGDMPYQAQFRIRSARDGEDWRWIESAGRATARHPDGRAQRVSGVLIDIHERRLAEERRKRDEEKLWSLANLDALTGLPNRSLFATRLDETVRRSAKAGRRAIVGVVDLDRFKEVNDSFGHLIGDEYLRKIAERMRAAVRETDIVGRLGGDEFAFVLGEVRTDADVERRVKRILNAICKPVPLSNAARRSGGSVGYAVFPDDGSEAGELLRRADVALYDAKDGGRRLERRFRPEMEARLSDGHGMRHDFEAALDRGEITVFYQPIIAAGSNMVKGFEALARWNHTEKGLLTPGAFAKALAEPDLAAKLGRTVRAQVFADIVAWRAAGAPVGRIGINVTTADFTQGGVTAELKGAIADGRIRPTDLCLEITEGVLLDGNANERIRRELADLKAVGFEIAFDDFGTGYASLSHLREYPFDRIKIDRSFVMNLPGSVRDLEIVRTIGILAEALSVAITAEGIETAEQADIVRRLGATDLQGFHFSKAMHRERVAGFITRFAAQTTAQDEEKEDRRYVA